MNWTGGKLNRHAKPHASDKLKAQRNFFAQASRHRRNQRTWSDLPIYTEANSQPERMIPPETRLHKHDKITFSDNHSHSRRSSHRSKQYVQDDVEISSRKPAIHPKSVRSEQLIARSVDRFRVDARVAGADPPLRDARKYIPTIELPASITEMKRKLLNQSDWLGLSAHRPVDINFAPANDIARIGRHRRSRQPKHHDSQNHRPDKNGRYFTTRTATGKRKRSEQEEQPAQPYRTECLSSTASQEPSDESQRNRLLEDPDRRFYVLANDELHRSVSPENLLSLEDARKFDSFDAVTKRHLESKISGSNAQDREGSGTRDAYRASRKMQTARSQFSSNVDPSRPESAKREPSLQATPYSPISLTRCETPLEQVQEQRNTKQPKHSLFPVPENLCVATRDLGFSYGTSKGQHKLRIADSEDSNPSVNHSCTNTFAQGPRETSSSAYGVHVRPEEGGPVQIFLQARRSHRNNADVRPKVRFQLDEVFELDIPQDVGCDHDVFSEEHAFKTNNNTFPQSIFSPHFLNAVEPDKPTQQDDITPRSPSSTNVQSGEAESLEAAGVRSAKQEYRCEVWKSPLTGMFLDSPQSSAHNATSARPQCYLASPLFQHVQEPSQNYGHASSLTSRSSLVLDDMESSPYIYSREPR